jgi:hypothetical protein
LVPFEDDALDDETIKSEALKANPFFKKSNKPSASDFQKAADETNNKVNSYKDRAAELASSFKKILDDKTLIQNKNVFSLDLEKEIISNLARLAIDMNTDENEIEGIGSVSIITLLLRSSIIQRDKINSLEYKTSLLENRIKELESAAKKSV